VGVAVVSFVLWGDNRNQSGSDVETSKQERSEAPGVLATGFAVGFGSLVLAGLTAASRFTFGGT
jgi:hypothetical protein